MAERAIEIVNCCCPECGRLFAHLPYRPDGTNDPDRAHLQGRVTVDEKITHRAATCVCGWTGVIIDARRI